MLNVRLGIRRDWRWRVVDVAMATWATPISSSASYSSKQQAGEPLVRAIKLAKSL
jgi:anti-sigma-K factor RskA